VGSAERRGTVLPRAVILLGGAGGGLATIIPWLAKSGNIQTDLWFTLPLFGVAVFAAMIDAPRAPLVRWQWRVITLAALLTLIVAGLDIGSIVSKLGTLSDAPGAISRFLSHRQRLWLACYLVVAAGAALEILGVILARRRARSRPS